MNFNKYLRYALCTLSLITTALHPLEIKLPKNGAKLGEVNATGTCKCEIYLNNQTCHSINNLSAATSKLADALTIMYTPPAENRVNRTLETIAKNSLGGAIACAIVASYKDKPVTKDEGFLTFAMIAAAAFVVVCVRPEEKPEKEDPQPEQTAESEQDQENQPESEKKPETLQSQAA